MNHSTFDREGEWDIRVTVYHDGRRIGTCDAGGGTYDFAVAAVATNLERREIERSFRSDGVADERPCGDA